MKTRFFLGFSLLGLIILYFYSCGRDKKLDLDTASAVLPPGVVKKIIINPQARTLAVVTPFKPGETLFLPDRPSTITLDKYGELFITVKQHGTEMSPFIGIGVAERPRIYLGMYGFYYKRVDVGLFLSFHSESFRVTRGGFNIAYLVRKDMSVTVGLDNHKAPNVGITIKL